MEDVSWTPKDHLYKKFSWKQNVQKRYNEQKTKAEVWPEFQEDWIIIEKKKAIVKLVKSDNNLSWSWNQMR